VPAADELPETRLAVVLHLGAPGVAHVRVVGPHDRLGAAAAAVELLEQGLESFLHVPLGGFQADSSDRNIER
jgi:hypothetical protein